MLNLWVVLCKFYRYSFLKRRLLLWLLGSTVLLNSGMRPLAAQTDQSLFLPLVRSPNLIVSTFDDELNSDGDCSLREAIVAANTHSQVDECQGQLGPNFISLPIGVYPLMLAGSGEDQGATGDWDITSDLTILGEDRQSTRIDGGQLDRVLQVHANSIVRISNLTIHNGQTANGAASSTDQGASAENGAGLANWGDLTLHNVLLRDNSTGDGGAGKAGDPEDGKPGGSGGSGGGLYNNGQLRLRQSIITKNRTGNGGANGFNTCLGNAGLGGGIFNDYDGVLTIIDSTINDNQTGTGAICRTKPSFVNGGDGGDGGGLVNFGAATLVSTVIHTNRTGNGGDVSVNPATAGTGGRGGGIFNQGQLDLTNSTVSNNQTGKGGNATRGGNGGAGAGLLTTGQLTLNQVTLTANQTGRGGTGAAQVSNGSAGSGGGLLSTGTAAEIVLRNTILAGNSSARAWPDCGATVDSLGYNLIGDMAGCKLTGDLTGNLTDQNARLLALADNGGPTWTHALQAASPARNAGSCTDSADLPSLVDQRGHARPQGSACDIGAFEIE